MSPTIMSFFTEQLLGSSLPSCILYPSSSPRLARSISTSTFDFPATSECAPSPPPSEKSAERVKERYCDGQWVVGYCDIVLKVVASLHIRSHLSNRQLRFEPGRPRVVRRRVIGVDLLLHDLVYFSNAAGNQDE